MSEINRDISNAFLQDLLLQSKSEGLIPLLTVDWNDGPNVGTIRVVLHDQNVTYDGHTFTAGGFFPKLPNEDTTDIPLLQIVVLDTDQTVRKEVRKLDSRFPMNIMLELGLLSQVPAITTIEQRYTGICRNVKTTIDTLTVSVEIFADISREPLTPYKMSPAYGFNALRSR